MKDFNGNIRQGQGRLTISTSTLSKKSSSTKKVKFPSIPAAASHVDMMKIQGTDNMDNDIIINSDNEDNSSYAPSNSVHVHEVSYLAEKYEELQKQGDTYSKKIEVEKRRNEELDIKIKALQIKLLEVKKDFGGVHAAGEERVLQVKNGRLQENRMEKSLTKYNETCNINKKLREKIQSLRRQNVTQHQIHEKLDRDLHVHQNAVLKSVKATQVAYEARERAQRHIESSKQVHADGILSFENKWNEKKNLLEKDQHSMKEKPKLQSKSVKTKTLKMNVLQTRVTEIALKKDNNESQWSLAKKEVDLSKQQERQLDYTSRFARIWKETGEENIEDIITGYFKSEEQSFSLFNMINQMNTEMEGMEVDNNKLKELLESMSQGSSKDNDHELNKNSNHVKMKLEEAIKSSQDQARVHEIRFNESIAIIESTKGGLMNIFHKVGCPEEATSAQLTSTGVTDLNIMIFLGIIEERIGAIVHMHNLSSSGGIKNNSRKNNDDDIVQRGIAPLPPTTDDYVDSDEEYCGDEGIVSHVKPYSIAELQEKTSASINRQRDSVSHRKNKTTSSKR